MRDWYGGPGTKSGMLLRVAQSASAAAAFALAVSVNYHAFNAFLYMATAMFLQVIWSTILASNHIYALIVHKDLRDVTFVSVVLLGDWLTTTLSLSSPFASVRVVMLTHETDYCYRGDTPRIGTTGPLAVGLGLAASTLIGISFIVMFCVRAR